MYKWRMRVEPKASIYSKQMTDEELALSHCMVLAYSVVQTFVAVVIMTPCPIEYYTVL